MTTATLMWNETWTKAAYMASSALFLLCSLFSLIVNSLVSGGAIKSSSLTARFCSALSFCFACFSLFSIFSLSLGFKKYSPEASC